MKFYLMAGGLLLTAASVYGVTDYLQTKNKKAFKELYKEAPVVQTKEITVKDIKEEDYSRGKMEPLPASQKEVAVAPQPAKTKTLKKKKTSSYASAELKEELKPVAVETKNESVKPEASFAKAPTEKKSINKRITLKKFSRAAPREEVVEEKKQ
ncbi:MAG: hypothetical protein K2Q24_01875 [Chitinophagaceae bacterium]|jgi:hypothetical protein|nr:hypothetical protein [Chitinophagaceae bacterium]